MSLQHADDSIPPRAIARIEETRAALREAAGAKDRAGEGEGERKGEGFPRSRIFQLALSPGYRWLTAAVATAGVIAVWSRIPGRGVGLLVSALSVARRLRQSP